MTTEQNAIDYAKDQMYLGKIDAAQANVLIVQMMGFRVTNKLSSDVRKALNVAVKNKQLGRLKKDGLKPEVYYHINSRANALTEQERIFKARIESLKGCFA